MSVRLAFAVQVFVPKQVLIVDEALSVGDVAFQRKCMAALERFKEDGGTILLVSHDAQTIIRQCERCVLLSGGELLVDGPSKPVTDMYQKIMFSTPVEANRVITQLRQYGLEQTLMDAPPTQTSDNATDTTYLLTGYAYETSAISDSPLTTVEEDTGPDDYFDYKMPRLQQMIYGNGYAEIMNYGVYNRQGQKVNILVVGRRYRWVYWVKFAQTCHEVQFGMLLKTKDGLDVAAPASQRERVEISYIPTGALVEVSFDFRLNVVPGIYFLNAGVTSIVEGRFTYLHRIVDAYMLQVLARDRREMLGIAYIEPEFSYQIKSVDLAPVE
jgi:lipopolysaccharide transport system ATP-binding protein